MMDIKEYTTEDFVQSLYKTLLKRRDYLLNYETDEQWIIDTFNQELIRISNILKLINKNKI